MEQKVLQKIEQFKQKHLSRCQGHSPRPRGENHPRQPQRLWWVPVWSPTFDGLDFPLVAIVDNARRGKKVTYTQEIYKAKLDRLRSARLTHRDLVVTL
jgi:hypothetical protein